MCPNIEIGNLLIPSWYTMTLIGAVVSMALAVYLKPADFLLNRKEIFTASMLTVVASLFGARLLFIFLHWDAAKFQVSDLISYRGGFAYFGALVFAVLFLWIYAAAKRKSFLAFLDYAMPFLMLSQAFVRIGCLMAGCCYGKPAHAFFGAIFKSVDKLIRHPTQGYEALVLVVIYIITRYVYVKKKGMVGYTTAFTLILYGVGRFFVEFLRVDSPAIFLNITIAQLTCLSLALIGLAMKFSVRY